MAVAFEVPKVIPKTTTGWVAMDIDLGHGRLHECPEHGKGGPGMAGETRGETVPKGEGRLQIRVMLHEDEVGICRAASLAQLFLGDHHGHWKGYDIVRPCTNGSNRQQIELVRLLVPVTHELGSVRIERDREISEDVAKR
jgi:hypothetical protein